MGFVDAIKAGFQNYFNFQGRAVRSEFWYWMLFAILVGIVTSILDGVLGTGLAVNGIASLILLIPGISVAVRRLHDVNRSGWWYLLVFTGIGVLVLIYWYVQPTNTGENKY